MRVLSKEMVGDDETEDGVTEELEAFVRFLAVLLGAVRAVGERDLEEVRRDEPRADAVAKSRDPTRYVDR